VLGKNPKYANFDDFEYADGGKIVKGGLNIAKRLMSDEQMAGQAIGKAAESAGMKAPVTANKPLTTLQDFHTSLGDSVRRRAMEMQELRDSLPYKYDTGHHVFTEDSARKNWPPMRVLNRDLAGNKIMREDPNDVFSKRIIDPETGKPKRTPYEAGYKVRLEHAPDNWSEFVIPESAIKGDVEMAQGGGAFKKLEFNQNFDGGGIAVDLSEPSEGSRREPLLTAKDWANIKRNAPAVYDWAKQNVKDEASQLQSVKGMKDFALRTGAQYLGGIPDLANLGLMGVDALADTKLSSEKPWFGSEQYIDAMHKAGMLGENEFPIAETVAGVLAPAGLIKKGIKKGSQLYKGMKPEVPKKRIGGLTAMSR
jgi:hypothetical protein